MKETTALALSNPENTHISLKIRSTEGRECTSVVDPGSILSTTKMKNL
jgi:hypothetical protein